jgi:hypothetical protein
VKKQIPKDKLILFGVPIAGLLVGLLGYLALVAPQKSAASHLDLELAAVQTQIAAAHVKPPKPPSAQAVDIFRLTKAMPDSPDVAGILRDLTRMARASSVTIDNVKPSAVIPLTEGYGALPLAVTVTGKFGAVSAFLQRMQEQVSVGKKGRLRVDGRLFVANDVQITTVDSHSVSAALTLAAFNYGVAPPPAPVGPTGAEGATTTTQTTPAAGNPG